MPGGVGGAASRGAPLSRFRHGVFGPAPRRPRLPVEELGLERREEVLGDGVIPAVPLPTHRADDLVVAQHALIGIGRLLLGFKVSSQHHVV